MNPGPSTLSRQVRSLLEEAIAAYRDTPWAPRLSAALERADQPLRVAIAGRVKAGKSTLLNALVGEYVAATDAGECTKVVTWYEDGVSYRAWAHTRTGERHQLGFRRSGETTLVDLGEHAPADLERVVVEFPSSHLREMTMIDTPGTASISSEVSERTKEFLVDDAPVAAPADAVVYLMRQLHEADVDFLEAFHDDEFRGTSAVNAVGVLSRSDEIGPGRGDALDLARRVAGRYQRETRLRALVHTVTPVAGLLAEAGATLRQHEFEAFELIAAGPVAESQRLLMSVDRFRQAATSIAVTAEARTQLLDRFGLFGVRLSVALLQHGVVHTATELAQELVERSGLPELRRILLAQFADRADVLRAHAALRIVERALADHEVDAAERLRMQRERIITSAHEFAELQLLNDLSTGAVAMADEQRERVELLLGARGRAMAVRVGLRENAPTEQARAALAAELARWQELAEDPLADVANRRAASVLRRTCEGLLLTVG